ncbi:hypothetical protein BH10ACT3_BH10ACT3_10490 [soil metagenome]
MTVFLAAIVMISGNRSLKMSGSRKTRCSFPQSAVRMMIRTMTAVMA